MTRALLILGSGETSPTMVTPHQRLFARLDKEAPAVLLDSPYGFQENADELTERIQQYFKESVGKSVRAVTFRSAPPADPVGHALELQALRRAEWVFAGPGSPSYALRTWQDSAVPEILDARLRDGGVVVFASAAALTLGRFTIPVYEVYKVGESPRWLQGLDIFGHATGLNAAVIPHFNNAEGGTHDTRFCYLGERRLRVLEEQLPDDAFVLGVDEHTGLLIDLDTGDAEVVGRGQVTIRKGNAEHRFETGESTTLARIAELAAVPLVPATSATTEVDDGGLLGQARNALAADTPAAALALLVEADRQFVDGQDRSEFRSLLAASAAALDSPADATEVVRPLVTELLRLRDAARADKRWSDSDAIRDAMIAAGIEVKDTPDGTTWELTK